jgi:hypothetical protein
MDYKPKAGNVRGITAPTIPITAEIRKRLKAEQRRTKMTARALFADDPNLPDGLSASIVNRWLGGIVRQAPKAHLDYVLQVWQAVPDRHGLNLPGSRTHAKGRRWPLNNEDWIDLTPEMTARLQDELKRTGMKISNLKRFEADFPAGLSLTTIRNWKNNKVRTVQVNSWNFLIKLFANQPDQR